jgi:hypothetical protein
LLRLHDSRPVARAAGPMLQAASALTLGDSALRLAARAVLAMGDEWAGCGAAIYASFARLEQGVERHAASAQELARARRAAAAFFPRSPLPLASAELFRLVTVGAASSSGPALGEWLDAGGGAGEEGAGMGAGVAAGAAGRAAGLVRLSRCFEAGLAAVETLAVTRAARALETLLLCVADLQVRGGQQPGASRRGAARRAHASKLGGLSPPIVPSLALSLSRALFLSRFRPRATPTRPRSPAHAPLSPPPHARRPQSRSRARARAPAMRRWTRRARSRVRTRTWGVPAATTLTRARSTTPPRPRARARGRAPCGAC